MKTEKEKLLHMKTHEIWRTGGELDINIIRVISGWIYMKRLYSKSVAMCFVPEPQKDPAEHLYSRVDRALEILETIRPGPESECKTCGNTKNIKTTVNNYSPPRGNNQRRYLELQEMKIPCPDCLNKSSTESISLKVGEMPDRPVDSVEYAQALEKQIEGLGEKIKIRDEALQQILILNADKDSDIKWLCEQALRH
jgi:hypothetical protein